MSDPGNPGGEGSKEPPQNQQLLDLQEQFEQQQTFIAQLKEMLRKSEQSSSVSAEKVEKYASTLSEINARAKLSKIKRSESRKSDPETSSGKSVSTSKKSTVVTPAKEKINLLRQQLEENRAMIAERDKNQKHVEEVVFQLKAQFDESQAKMNEPAVIIPKIEKEVTTTFSIESSRDDLLFALKSKDEHIIELTAKVQQFQANVLDLQENLKEKDSVLDARTKAITLLSENLSKKGKDTLDMLEDTKEQMRHMQENFVSLESKMKEENMKLQSELVIKDKRIDELTDLNNDLQNRNSDLELQHLESENKILELDKLNDELQNKLRELEQPATSEKAEPSPQKTSKRKGSKKRGKETESKREESPQISETNRISELEKLVEELQSKLEESKNSDEVPKLNKQLEEMNKNMIKMKAQHKAKLKEIQKKSSPGEMSEKLNNLETENVKLGQRVAELEDEKGNLQLRLVDIESNKEKEYIADLENKIEEQKMEIENHIRTITSLESQITTSSNELSALRNELASMMHVENAQVCSEITSVQLEEQLDKEVSQKKEIQDKYNEIIRENENLLEKIETLNKEKQELSAKLDHYMQENIDLIDRLEKLSAEKVSSAESIEIVDALTQQEKLEIEAYQKNLDFVSDPDKPPDDMENNPDLNESVSKLNEETSELMEKIKLFTDERREVMEKMEQLNSKLEKAIKEKSEINEKYNELCKEKDSLLSRIEQLTSENGELKSNNEKSNDFDKIKEELIEYRAIIENQKLQIASLQEEIWDKSDNEAEKSASDNKLKELNDSLNNQIRTLQAEYESLYTVHESAKEDSKELINARNKITELESKIAENTEEITFLQEQIENNKQELIQASQKIVKQDAKMDIMEQEAEEYQKTMEELNLELDEKEKSNNDTVTALSLQLSELKSIISDNFEQLQQYEIEMNKNSQSTYELNEKLEELNFKIVDTEHLIELKNVEINSMKQEKSACEMKIQSLEKELEEKNDNFAEICRQLKEKCKFLENQIEANAGSIDDIKIPFEAKIAELEHKNKELVEKMKKIAANLKKKTIICQDLEKQLSEFKEKWENESKEKDEKQKLIDEQQIQLSENQIKIQSLTNQMQEIENELSNKNIEIDKINQNYQTLHSEKQILENNLQHLDCITSERDRLKLDLNEYIIQFENQRKILEEKDEQIHNITLEFNVIKSQSEEGSKQLVQNLMEQLESIKITHETTQNAMHAKLQEKDMFIENLEAENVKYKDRIDRLEEGLSNIEERRQLLEQRTLDLSVQLEEKSSVCEEVFQSENLLERRLSALLAHDEVIEKKLEQSAFENQTLTEKVKLFSKDNESLQKKINDMNLKLQESTQHSDKIELLENEISRLTTAISTSENELKKLHFDYERKLNEKNIEIENIDVELNAQLEELHAERKTLLNKCEVLQDNIKDYSDSYQLLTEEMDQLKDNLAKLKQDLVEKEQNVEMHVAKTLDLENKLRNVQNAQIIPENTDIESQSLKTEIDRLQQIINQKDIDIQNYQRQNMQLQMSSFSAPSTASFFAEPQIVTEQIQQTSNNAKYEILEQELTELKKKISSSENELLCAKDKIEELQSKYTASQNELQENKVKFDNLQDVVTRQNEIEHLFHASQNELHEKEMIINNLQQELAKQQEMLVRKTAKENVDEIISTAEKTVSESVGTDVPIFDEIFQKEAIAESFAALQSTPPGEVTKQELLRKIKALEFMLFNVEKEKDDTLVQCHEFTNELARLIYEREKLITDKPPREPKPDPDMPSIENQIVSTSEADTAMQQTKDMHSLEFPPLQVQINKDYCENITPVVEEMIQPKKTYLCFTGEEEEPPKHQEKELPKHQEKGWGTEDSKLQESVGAQIVPMDATKITPEDKKLFEQFQFGPVNIPKDTQDHTSPVIDCIPAPKHAYLCYPSEPEKPPVKDTVAKEEEGWGWGTEDSKLQESVGAQIVKMDATKITPEDKKLFDQMQYGPVNIPKEPQDHTSPVIDCIPDPKHAYLCYPTEPEKPPVKDTVAKEEEGWGWGTEDSKLQDSVGAQIVKMDATKITPEDKKLFDQMQYGPVNIPKEPQDHTTPISDCIPDPKHAYLCYPSETKNIIVEDTFASEEDGWGWSAEEAKLEAEHRMSLSAAPPQIDSRVEQLEERIHDLEVERSRLLEEIKSSQVRSGKLIKKLKILKENNDKLVAEASKKSSGDFCGLEMAIQDELNSQVQTLEKKIKELMEENSKDKTDRDNLSKRLEVLTNANDRMVEMKEKQDNEIQFLHFKNRELAAKLEQLEWGDDSPGRSKTPTNITIPETDSGADVSEHKKRNEDLIKKIAELNSNINDLTLDNEEMQCMLEEQRNMRLEAEKALSNRPVPENMKTEQEFLKVENENRNLHEELTKLNDVQTVLQNKFATTENDNKYLQEELQKLNDLKQVLENQVSQHIINNSELTEKSNHLQLNIENLIQENQLLNNQFSVKIEQLQNENIELQNQISNINMDRENILRNQVDPLQITQLQNENIQLQNQLSNVMAEKETALKNQMDANQLEINQIKSEISRLEEENRRLESLLLEKEQNLQNFSIKIQQLEQEKISAETKLQEFLNLQDKTNDEKIQQMNQQLLTALSDLDNKNKEIVELNNMLSNERSIFEQKLSQSLEQVAQQWIKRVDQRGNDVAESWKLHVETVENEFTQKEEKLRAELNTIFKQNEELLSQNNALQAQVQSVLSEKQSFVSDNNNTIDSLQQSVNNKQIEITDLLENVRNKESEILELSQTVSNKESEILQLSQNVQDKEIQITELLQNIKNKESEMIELSQKLLESSAELQIKNSEIINLQLTFEEMQSKEIKYQQYIQQYAQQLEEKTAQCNELYEKINEANVLSQEEEKQISDLKMMIENQVLKIEDYKREIEQKDAEYNALVVEYEKLEDSFLKTPQVKQEIQHISAEQPAKETLEPASRAELDLALYMLHQRDVRCEELTVELMELLKERDILQLKLSNEIRLNEEHKTKLDQLSETAPKTQDSPKSTKSTGAIPRSKSTAIVLGATGTELATEATENIIPDTTTPQDTDELSTKLSQLSAVGYNRDKTLRDDQEIRHIQQMTLMQQHRDLAAKLPPEAAARLVDASYTVSRDVQSPSKVLLNWLWGRSTPKVNDV